jgi:uncharacterized membrane protein (DUF106 family)
MTEQSPTLNLEKDKNAKKGSFLPIVIVMIASWLVVLFWDKVLPLKNFVHSLCDPSAGALLNWNLTIGMIILVFVIVLITTLIQKYTTDQKTLKELKQEQKSLNEEIKKFKDNPEKAMELNKRNMELISKTFKLTSRSMLFTSIPFLLFFRWFNDFFTALGEPKFFGFLSWFWFYFIFAMIFSSFLRKWMKVV